MSSHTVTHTAPGNRVRVNFTQSAKGDWRIGELTVEVTDADEPAAGDVGIHALQGLNTTLAGVLLLDPLRPYAGGCHGFLTSISLSNAAELTFPAT